MISRVPPPALPHLRPALWLAGPARPVVGCQERRTARAAARGRRAAPHQSPTPAGLGGPRGSRRADPPAAWKAADDGLVCMAVARNLGEDYRHGGASSPRERGAGWVILWGLAAPLRVRALSSGRCWTRSWLRRPGLMSGISRCGI